MPPVDAMRLIDEDLVLDGIPMRNLATFVTTWMEPEAQRLIAENLHRNYIDHAEYPQTAEIEQRCIRMIADLFNAPGETRGTRTQGSSEAIMLGALSLKWKWRERREQAGKSTEKPNLVFGGDVHVVWDKFCRYFDVEPRIIPLQPDKLTIGPEDVEPHLDENTIGVGAVLGTTFTGHADDIAGINKMLLDFKEAKGIDIPLHVDGASGGFVWPFLYPDTLWDFRLEQVRSINVSGPQVRARLPGHRVARLQGTLRPARGPGLLRELPRQARRDVHAELLDRGRRWCSRSTTTSCASVARATPMIIGTMQHNAQLLARKVEDGEHFELVGPHGHDQLPLVAYKLAGERAVHRVRHRLPAVRRARLDGPRLHAAAECRPRHRASRAVQGDARAAADRSASRRTCWRRSGRSTRRAPCTSSSAAASRRGPATEPGERERGRSAKLGDPRGLVFELKHWGLDVAMAFALAGRVRAFADKVEHDAV